MIVEHFQSVIGREARGQMLDIAGELPDYVVACVGGGSNSIGIFNGFLQDENVNLIGVEPLGKGEKLGDNAASINFGRVGELHGFKSMFLQDEEGNVVIKKVGEPTKFNFTPLDHIELMEKNNWSELERITKVSGARTYAIKNELSRLELAMHMLVLDKLASHGFTTITVPSISKQNNLGGNNNERNLR